MASNTPSQKSKSAVAAAKKKTEAKTTVAALNEEETDAAADIDKGTATKSIAEAKEEALSLIEEDDAADGSKVKKKRARVARDERSGAVSGVLPPISRIGEEKEPAAKSEAEPEEGEKEAEQPDSNVIHIKPPIIVRDLADRMGIKAFKLIQDLMQLDIFANPNQSVEPDVAAQICEKHGFVFEKEKREKGGGVHKVEEIIEQPEVPIEPEEEELRLRAPIITFMGHVDHGKTSLLDALRKSRVTAGEAGGITQHIGAYSVEHKGTRITLIDTPGHAAFTEMRARGANVTDIVVLVVAADDGVMPQTLEAISHARAAGVTIMVAINKIDLPGADVNKVKAQLQEHGLAPEDWGGNTVCVEVSATQGLGIDDLVEMMSLQSEILELKASPKGIARATVIESRMEAGKGPTATVIVGSGTLRAGQPFICGPFFGKVKSLISDTGKAIKEADPATPVEVLGFSALPNVGDELVEMESERAAKRLSEERLEELRRKKLEKPAGHTTLETLFANIEEGDRQVLRVVLKTDVAGSEEAIVGALSEIKSDKIEHEILHSAAGPITESDIMLASASDAIIIGFNTKLESKAVAVARREGVQVKLFSIIYELIDQVRDAMEGMLEPEVRESHVGHAKVKEVFKLSSGRVAGCVVTDGRISRSARARVIRGQLPVYDGGLATLRRFQDDVNEVRNGLECGIKLGNFNDYEVDDIIECYELEKIVQTL